MLLDAVDDVLELLVGPHRAPGPQPLRPLLQFGL